MSLATQVRSLRAMEPYVPTPTPISLPIPESLEALAYHFPWREGFAMDETVLERGCPLDLGRHHIDPRNNLGVLDALPEELLGDIFVQLDLQSLVDFRRVNQRAMQVVNSIPQFRTIVKHSLSPLRSMINTGAASRVTCQDLFEAMSRWKCRLCDDFAGFIYLFDCSRLCSLCFSRIDEQYHERLMVRYDYRNYGSRLGFPPPFSLWDTMLDEHRISGHLRTLVRAPFVTSPDGPVEWGFHCVGCKDYRRRRIHWRRKYNAETFDAHILECGRVINGEHESSNGQQSESEEGSDTDQEPEDDSESDDETQSDEESEYDDQQESDNHQESPSP